jgi:DNA helicase-2/ATP-dependent DNA helicase PcrA
MVGEDGLEQDLFPHSRGDGASVENREEERRLFYVAVTRAGKKLYLSYATIRTLFGMREVRLPSEFLYDLPDELVTREVGHTPRIKTFYLD